MKATVRKWGHSAAVRIPAAIMAAARLRLDQRVEIREELGRVVIEPIRPAAYDLAELVAGITDNNRHYPVDMGPPAVKEAW